MTDAITTLNEASENDRCLICGVDDSLPVKGRLTELGFYEGAVIERLQVGSFGSPIACRVSGAVIAVRSSDAGKISVKVLR